MAMDRPSITSKHGINDSDGDSFHSGQGQIARTVSMARRYPSAVSLYNSSKPDNSLTPGKTVRSTASENSLPQKSHGQYLAEPRLRPRPKTSYMFSLGKEHDGLVEIIPEDPLCDDVKHDSLVELVPETSICRSYAESTIADDAVSYQQWRASALLPLQQNHSRVGSETCASSIYSQDDRGSTNFDYASSVQSRESEETVRTRTLTPGQLHLGTRSLLSLAERYSSNDDGSIYSNHEREALVSPISMDYTVSKNDDRSIYSRDGAHQGTGLTQRRPSSRAGAMASTHSLPARTRKSWDHKPLPPLPIEQDEQTWQSPVSPISPTSRDGRSRGAASKSRRRGDSMIFTSPLSLVTRSATRFSERSVSSCSQATTMHRRPSSWSWLSIDRTMSDQPSRNGSRKSTQSSIFHGQRYLRILSMPASMGRASSPGEQVSPFPASPPPIHSGTDERESPGSENHETSSIAPTLPPKDGRSVSRQDPLQLPPMQLPELPDEQRVLFYAQCGHLETGLEVVGNGPELPGWCPPCFNARQRKRRVVKKELKSILRSIAE